MTNVGKIDQKNEKMRLTDFGNLPILEKSHIERLVPMNSFVTRSYDPGQLFHCSGKR